MLAGRPIYLDDKAELCCWVDAEDYAWATQWRWKPIRSRGKKHKLYAFRTTRMRGGATRRVLAAYLIADHLDGESTNDRRANLRWATRSENNRNLNGVAYQQLRLAVLAGDLARVTKVSV